MFRHLLPKTLPEAPSVAHRPRLFPSGLVGCLLDNLIRGCELTVGTRDPRERSREDPSLSHLVQSAGRLAWAAFGTVFHKVRF